MTRFDPTLRIAHLIVTRAGVDVFAQSFRQGLNVLAGENGSGKTTIADFIIFALGGEPRNWREAALECDSVLAELALNGQVVSVWRDIERGTPRRPLRVFVGDLQTARAATADQWQVYPYSTQGDRRSFSQVLLSLLGLVDVVTEGASRVTMHQMLRLLYIDQNTPSSELFVHEDFDQAATRIAVGDLLLGVYDHEMHVARDRLRQVSADIAVLTAEARSVSKILGAESGLVRSSDIDVALAALETERAALYALIASSQSGKDSTKSPKKGKGERLRSAIAEIRAEAARLSREIERLGLEVEDSKAFVEALGMRESALGESEAVHALLGDLESEHCPACFSPLPKRDERLCRLCGEERNLDQLNRNRTRLRIEIIQQKQESERRLLTLMEELEHLRAQLVIVSGKERELAVELNAMEQSVLSHVDEQVSEWNQSIGAIGERIAYLLKRRELAVQLQHKEERLGELAAEAKLLELEVMSREEAQQVRRSTAVRRIGELTAEYLRRDLEREEEFVHATDVTFDMNRNRVWVNERGNFAASSMVYLKNSFHLALFVASCELEFMRLPRFMLFDNVEDKGMEPLRSQNFQRLIMEESTRVSVEHQVIVLTSMLDPTVGATEHLLRDPFTHEDRSLSFSGARDNVA